MCDKGEEGRKERRRRRKDGNEEGMNGMSEGLRIGRTYR